MKHADVEAEPLENGDLILTYRVAVRPWLDRLLRRLGRGAQPPLRRKVQLDTLGTQVWQWIDGERSVDEIVRAFSKAHRLSHREAELSVTAFLRMLGKRGLIGMREPE
ncbi:MAG: PqqD family protein [Desulfosarcinaceae bacterium]